MALTIVLGLASRRFAAFLPAFLGKYPGDALWSLMVFFGLGALFPKAPTLGIASGALGFSFAIELLKLYQAEWLVELRASTLGHLVFGHSFTWQNFIAYTVGVFVGVLIESIISPRRPSNL